MGCLPSNCAEEPVFASLRVLMLALSKKNPKKPRKTKQLQQNPQYKQTNPPTLFPVLELLSELSFKFKGIKFLTFSSTSGNIHPVTEVWAHSTIRRPGFLQGSVVRTWRRAHCAKHSFPRFFFIITF